MLSDSLVGLFRCGYSYIGDRLNVWVSASQFKTKTSCFSAMYKLIQVQLFSLVDSQSNCLEHLSVNFPQFQWSVFKARTNALTREAVQEVGGEATIASNQYKKWGEN